MRCLLIALCLGFAPPSWGSLRSVCWNLLAQKASQLRLRAAGEPAPAGQPEELFGSQRPSVYLDVLKFPGSLGASESTRAWKLPADETLAIEIISNAVLAGIYDGYRFPESQMGRAPEAFFDSRQSALIRKRITSAVQQAKLFFAVPEVSHASLAVIEPFGAQISEFKFVLVRFKGDVVLSIEGAPAHSLGVLTNYISRLAAEHYPPDPLALSGVVHAPRRHLPGKGLEYMANFIVQLGELLGVEPTEDGSLEAEQTALESLRSLALYGFYLSEVKSRNPFQRDLMTSKMWAAVNGRHPLQTVSDLKALIETDPIVNGTEKKRMLGEIALKAVAGRKFSISTSPFDSAINVYLGRSYILELRSAWHLNVQFNDSGVVGIDSADLAGSAQDTWMNFTILPVEKAKYSIAEVQTLRELLFGAAALAAPQPEYSNLLYSQSRQR